ncbi:DUF397 domain-containing protein [Streptomyces sp. TRM43335]|uniref:DUF397 domain-containing protein n=1 Tax=Streptomyces taklimakanensis TaxID=2569853 RepID=A0A6G2BCA2_9ACTN|nr:DUF397 domain-containing protein [Streptomyces taklimakanensis]MTE19905.1 DUF397 domain-containing protein [Streptomyces taklimakanensis]
MPDSTTWTKSSFSEGEGANCVEVTRDGDRVLIRESDRPDEIVVTTPAKLDAFLKGVKAGEFDHFVDR